MKIDKDFNLIIGLRIRELRESLGMSREAFSEKCDLSSSFLAAVENGTKGITAKTIYKICNATNVSADYIINGHEHGFETDIVIEHLATIEAPYRKYAIRLLTEYCNAIHHKSNTEH